MSSNIILFAEKSVLPKDDHLFYDVAKFVGVGGPVKPDTLSWAQLRVAVGEWRYDSIFIAWLRMYSENTEIYDGYSGYLDTENLECFLREVEGALLTEKATRAFWTHILTDFRPNLEAVEYSEVYAEMIRVKYELINILDLRDVDYLYLDQDY